MAEPAVGLAARDGHGPRSCRAAPGHEMPAGTPGDAARYGGNRDRDATTHHVPAAAAAGPGPESLRPPPLATTRWPDPRRGSPHTYGSVRAHGEPDPTGTVREPPLDVWPPRILARG